MMSTENVYKTGAYGLYIQFIYHRSVGYSLRFRVKQVDIFPANFF